ncbi:MAG: polysaccharide biosynthesis tyrosine autokinase [Synechococcales cyanobacterium C42_A2020_086]|jgi:capsular exopolysaccharide synthesis family protein|nr:polysaccharide biosynthesis tyrosine autokinase [Synechococcales cyanobacterium C42_A2020_086]
MKVPFISQSVVSQAASPSINPFSAGDEGGLELGRVLAILRRRVLLIVSVTTMMMAVAVLKALTDTPIYKAGFEILTRAVTVETEVLSSLPQTLTSRQEQNQPPESLDATKIKVLRSPSLLSPVVEQLRVRYPDITYAAFVQSLGIQADGQNILVVSYSHPDPEVVEFALELLSDAYLQYSLQERQKDIRQGIEFVEQQLPNVQRQVEVQQERLQTFRQKYNLIDPQSQAEQLTDQIGEVTQELIRTETQLNEARLLYQGLRRELSQPSLEITGTSSLNASPRYQKLLDQLLAIDSQLAEDSTLYLPESPEVDVLLEQRQNLLPLLQQEGVRVERQVSGQIQELENRRQSLNATLSALNQQIRQLSAITREYTDIQRELEIATANLNQFLAKREGLRIDAAQRQVPWQLLTAPGDPIPNSASLKRTLALGTILGLLLGIGIALMVDKLSSVIHSVKELKGITKLPILGVIPTHKQLNQPGYVQPFVAFSAGDHLSDSAGDRQFSQHSQQMSGPFREAFRSLYANIRLVSPDQPLRVLAISSAVPASGKTTISLYLAQAAAGMGQRVLLLDADLRRSSLHDQLNLVNPYGLTDVVSGTVEFDQAIQKTAFANLFVMTAGARPPDPTRILSSRTLQHILEKGREQFDLIICDTPPLLGFADTYLLSVHTDGILLVTRLGHLKRSLFEQTLEDLSVASAPVMGIVANDSKEKLSSAYSYYLS